MPRLARSRFTAFSAVGWVAAVAAVGFVVVTLVAPAPNAAAALSYQAMSPKPVTTDTPIDAGETVVLRIPDVPADADSAWLSFTAQASESPSRLIVCDDPGAETCVGTTLLDVSAGAANTTSLRLPISSDGTFAVRSSGDVRLSVNLGGFFRDPDSFGRPTASLFHADFQALPRHVKLEADDAQTVTFPDAPEDSAAVAVTVTAYSEKDGELALCPSDDRYCTGGPTVVLGAGHVVVKSAIVKLSDAESLSVRGDVDANVELRIAGYFAPGTASDGAMAFGADARSSSSRATDWRWAMPGLNPRASAVMVRLDSSASTASTVLGCALPEGDSTCLPVPLLATDPDGTATNTVLVRLPEDSTGEILFHNPDGVPVVARVVGFVLPSVPPSSPSPDETAFPSFTSDVGESGPQPSPTPTPTPTPGATPSETAGPADPDAPAEPAPADPGPPGSGSGGTPGGSPPPGGYKVHNGDLIITTPGAVVDGYDIRGLVSVRAPNVVIKNSIIRGRAVSSDAALLSNPNGDFFTVTDTELYAANQSPYISGIIGSNFVATRVNIHHVIDNVHIVGNNVTVTGSWLHDNLHYANDPHHSNGSHDDSIQIQRGTNLKFTNNTISGSHNAAIMITQDTGDVGNVVVSGNTIGGGACSINVAEKSYGPIMGLSIVSNLFTRSTAIANCAVIAPSTTHIDLRNNKYTPDGANVAVSKG